MTTNKLAGAKDWRNRPLDKWNVSTFHAYLADRHKEIFGIDYAPFGGTWSMEQGALGTLIGTQSRDNPKSRTASNEDVKRFIDQCYATYPPTKDWPGTNFGFMWSYRKVEWQRICAATIAQARREEAVAETDIDELADWFAE